MAWIFANIKWVVIGIAIASLLGYIEFLRLDVKHQKAESVKWQGMYTAYRATSESNSLALKSENLALTLAAKQASIDRMKLENAAKAQIAERIKNDKISASIRIPASVLQLQHDTTIPAGAGNVTEPSGANGNNAKNPQSASEGVGSTVNSLLAADAINNPELNSCVDTVIEWNKFWDKFVNNIKATENVAKN